MLFQDGVGMTVLGKGEDIGQRGKYAAEFRTALRIPGRIRLAMLAVIQQKLTRPVKIDLFFGDFIEVRAQCRQIRFVARRGIPEHIIRIDGGTEPFTVGIHRIPAVRRRSAHVGQIFVPVDSLCLFRMP